MVTIRLENGRYVGCIVSTCLCGRSVSCNLVLAENVEVDDDDDDDDDVGVNNSRAHCLHVFMS